MARSGKLTPKQERFVEEYLIDLNGAAAYRRAGYRVGSETVARVEACRLLTNPSVAAALAAAKRERSGRVEVKADRVLEELACLALSDVGEVVDMAGDEVRLRRPGDVPERARRAISSIKVRRHVEGVGKDARTVEVTEFKLWDKNAALEKLGRHLGLLKDGAGVQTVVNVNWDALLAGRAPADLPERRVAQAALPGPAEGGQS